MLGKVSSAVNTIPTTIQQTPHISKNQKTSCNIPRRLLDAAKAPTQVAAWVRFRGQHFERIAVVLL